MLRLLSLPRILAAVLASLALGAGAGRAENPPAGAPAAAPAVTVPVTMNSTCPIMGKPASKALFAETPNGRIYVCCPPCIAKIQKDPERAYKAAYPVTKAAGNTVCPITDKPLGADAVAVVLQGYEVRVCATCAEAARASSQVVLAKALDPRVTEVRNATCPVTGQPVTANAFCLVGTELIHLSSPKAVEEVRKDPARYLRAAKESAAREAAARTAGGGAPSAR